MNATNKTAGGRTAAHDGGKVKMNLRLSPDLHSDVALLAAADRKQISPWISSQLERLVAERKAKA